MPPVPQQPSTTPAPAPSRVAPTTLVASAAGSGVAAYVVSQVWGPGTIIGAAVTPVIVAFVAEAVRRPAERVQAVTPVVVPRHRATAEPGSLRPEDPTVVRPPTDPTLIIAGSEEPTVYQAASAAPPDPGRNRRRWRLALITGLLAFAIIVVLFTVRDLVAGDGLGGHGRSSTFSLRRGRSSRHTSSTTTHTTTATTVTSTPTATSTVIEKTVTQSTPSVSTKTVTTPTTSTPTGATGPSGTGGP